MKQREPIKNPEPRNLSEVLKECHDLVADLRVKLKSKVDQVIDLRKEIDRLSEDQVFDILIRWSFADYLWDWLSDSCSEFVD